MNKKLAINSFKKNKLISVTTSLFIAFAAMLVAMVFLLMFNLFGSIDNLMDKAKTPDFLQLHQGELDLGRMENFAKNNENVKDFQVLEFINVDGEKIIINGKSQKDAVQDIGIVFQSEKFDQLLDFDNKVIATDKGMIHLPIMYLKEGYVSTGDKVQIYDKTFQVQGFFRDSQMNSNMAGSKRILLNKADFEEIKENGQKEYFSEFLLKDRSKMTEFEIAYKDKKLESNGPTVTHSLFKLMNGLNDGIVIGVLLLASFLILFISFMCISFTITAKLEDEYTEIGVMKALGLNIKDVKKLYLGQYLIIALFGVILGYALSMIFQGYILKDLFLYMGKSSGASMAPLFAVLGVVALFFIILIYINSKLNKIKKISPVQAIKFGESSDNNSRASLKLGKLKALSTSFSLALADIYSRKKMYLTSILVIFIATFLMTIPQNISHTLKDKSFAENFGIGGIDITIDVPQTSANKENISNISSKLSSYDSIKSYTSVYIDSTEIKLESGKRANLLTYYGNHEKFPVKYSQGRMPKNDNEIALSNIYIQDLELKLGDKIRKLDGNRELKIVGIYSDITNGGKTAKLKSENLQKANLRNSFYIKLKDENKLQATLDQFNKDFEFAKVSSLYEYIDQSFGVLNKQIELSSIISIIVSLLIIALITIMFTKVLISKNKSQISILKALGFTDKDITYQYMSRFIVIMIIAIPIALILAKTLGSIFATMMISSFGVDKLDLKINLINTLLLTPISIIATVLISCKLATLEIKQIHISDYIKE